MHSKVDFENIVPHLKRVPLCPTLNWSSYAFGTLCLLPPYQVRGSTCWCIICEVFRYSLLFSYLVILVKDGGKCQDDGH